MAFKDILARVESSSPDSLLEAAVTLARGLEAHLVGLHVFEPQSMPAYATVEFRSTVLQYEAKQLQAAGESAKARFDQAVAGTSLSAEWRAVKGHPADAVSLQGRYADLVVVEQPSDDDRGTVDRILLGTGRPVMLVPRYGHFTEIGKRVLVAWDESREAARAVSDAMPLLKRASAVTVISVAGKPSAVKSDSAASRDLSHHLARHGLKVESSYDIAGELDVADILLSRAADLSADLLVMGAYGHPRISELLLGGVTRSILEHMTIPVLMSH